MPHLAVHCAASELQDVSDAKHADPYAANRALRAKLRAVKAGDAALEKR